MATLIDKYGTFPFDWKFFNELFSFGFKQGLNSLIYFKEISNLVQSSFLSVNEIESITIQPSEPLVSDLPKTLLFLELKEPISLLPESGLFGYFEFPISISLVIHTNKKSIPLDLFNFSSIKFALYGNPHNGNVCRFWKTNFYHNHFTPSLFKTGLLEIEIQNTSNSLLKLNKLILDFSYIQIFYNETIAKARAKVKIQSESYCETEFITPTLTQGFQQSLDLIPTKILSSSKFIMLNGI
ncbi:MAG: DUF432 domain-containing protein [Ignavibacteria bacterium]|nr:DUF432 domain-containing protein [Ignavibacteria bacterium]